MKKNLILLLVLLMVIPATSVMAQSTPDLCQTILAVANQQGMQEAHLLVYSMPDPSAVFADCSARGWSREFVAQLQAFGGSIEVEHGQDALGGLETGAGASSIRVGMLDMIFVIDTTGSMNDDIDQAKSRAREIISQVASSGLDWRMGLVTYRDYPDGTNGELSDYQVRAELGFSSNPDEISAAINRIVVDGGANSSESVYSGLMMAMSYPFRNGAQKVLVLMGDAPPHNPEPGTGYDQRTVLTTAFNLDPVNIYPILVDNNSTVRSSFASLADGSSGRLFYTSSAAEFVPVLLSTIETATGDTHLHIGGRARVYTTAGDTLNVRAGTNTRQEILQQVPINTVLDIVGGPVFEYPYVWWQVRTPRGVVGWSVEAADGIVTLVNIPDDEVITGPTMYAAGNMGSCTTPGSHLVVGGRAVVTNPTVPYIRVRSTPWLADDNRLDTLASGTVVDVLNGPYAGSDYVWWYIRYNDLLGYAVEVHCDSVSSLPNNLTPVR